MLKLAGNEDGGSVMCPRCEGRGRVPCPETQAVRSGVGGDNLRGGTARIMCPGAGSPIPCPMCNGKKIVRAGTLPSSGPGCGGGEPLPE